MTTTHSLASPTLESSPTPRTKSSTPPKRSPGTRREGGGNGAYVCEKKRYPSKTAAQMALIDIWTRKRNAIGRNEGRTYWCHGCSAYHLTSKPKRRSPSR